jgi:subtilisin family serine protease
MNTNYLKNKRLPVMLSLLLLLCASVTLLAQPTAKADKIAPDVRALIQKAKTSTEPVRVVIQLQGNPSLGLTKILDGQDIKGKRLFRNLNVYAFAVPAGKVEQLSAFSEVHYIAGDNQFRSLGHVTATTGADAVPVSSGNKAKSTAINGAGIGIAIVDSGIQANHKMFMESSANGSFSSRVVYSEDFTGEGRTDDPYGHGTHVAGIAAGNGLLSGGAYRGIAPGAHLINLRVLNAQGQGTTAGVLQALEWLLVHHSKYKIYVVNLSIGTPAINSAAMDPLCLAVRKLHDKGVLVVAAAGNHGKDGAGQKLYGLIHSPGNEPSVLTVGAVNTFGTDSRDDDRIASYSSRGPARSYWTDSEGVKHYDNTIKPELVAPGNKLVSAQAASNSLVFQNPALNVSGSSTASDSKLMTLSGTSMAAPVVAGAAALLFQSEAMFTPSMVKAFLMYSAQQLPGHDTLEQGAGLLNIEGAVRLGNDMVVKGWSLSYPAPPKPESTIAGTRFPWAQGVLLSHSWARGEEFITKYQRAYMWGYTLNEGVTESYSSVTLNPDVLSAGIMVGDGIMVADGTRLGEGQKLMNSGMLLSDGIMLADGIMVADGIMASDGIMVADGIMLADAVLKNGE